MKHPIFLCILSFHQDVVIILRHFDQRPASKGLTKMNLKKFLLQNIKLNNASHNKFCSVCSLATQIASFMGQNGTHPGPTGPRWAPCWPHELCYLGKFLSYSHHSTYMKITKISYAVQIFDRQLLTFCFRINGACLWHDYRYLFNDFYKRRENTVLLCSD